MSPAELIELSLTNAAEKAEDIVPLVYPRFFKQYPEAKLEFGDDPNDFSKGQMLVNMLMEIIDQADNKSYPQNLQRLFNDHRAYGLVPKTYSCMFDCLRDTIKELNGKAWTEAMNQAWQAQFDKLMWHINEVYA